MNLLLEGTYLTQSVGGSIGEFVTSQLQQLARLGVMALDFQEKLVCSGIDRVSGMATSLGIGGDSSQIGVILNALKQFDSSQSESFRVLIQELFQLSADFPDLQATILEQFSQFMIHVIQCFTHLITILF